MPAVVNALGSGFFRRRGIEVVVVASMRELVERTLARAPDVVIAAARGESLPAATVTRVRRVLPARARLLLATAAESIERVDALGAFDGIISIADPGLDLLRVLDDRLPPRRWAPRRALAIPIVIYSSRRPRLTGCTVDLAPGGVGLVVGEPLVLGAPLQLLFEAGPRSCLVRGAAIWLAAGADGLYRCGVRFLAPAAEASTLLFD